jgi:outer membrane PBP1 activator LpoA protein
MTLSLVPLLLHEADVPASARAALRQASRASSERRREWLEAAAFALTREAHLDGDDARALVGLDD